MAHKGGALIHATKEWFQTQYKDLSRTMKVKVDRPFNVKFSEFQIVSKPNPIQWVLLLQIKGNPSMILILASGLIQNHIILKH